MREEVWVSCPASRPFCGRLLPTLLPSRWTPPGSGGQLWDVGPARGPDKRSRTTCTFLGSERSAPKSRGQKLQELRLGSGPSWDYLAPTRKTGRAGS
jgi:hypothetical protein